MPRNEAAAVRLRGPETIDEAIDLLAAGEDAKLLAGGQSLVPLLNMRLASAGAARRPARGSTA